VTRLIFLIGLIGLPLMILGLLTVPMRIPKTEPGLAGGSVIAEDAEIAASVPPTVLNCTMPRPNLDTRIYVLRLLHGGKETPVLQSSYDEGSQVDVFVTETSGPVVLVLVGGSGIVWNLRVHPKSRILGVVVAGDFTQRVVGASSAASLIQSLGQCYALLQRYFPPQSHSYDEASVRNFVADALGRPITSFQDKRSADELWAGPEVDMPPSQLDDMPFVVPSDLVDNHRPILFGRPALKRLVQEGTIRQATKEDLDDWIASGVNAVGIHADLSKLDLDRTYVVKRFFRMPMSLMGRASTAFIVPSGVTKPEGEVWDSMVLTYQPYGCFWSGGFFGNCAGFSPK
jgi:hypothetical protein